MQKTYVIDNVAPYADRRGSKKLTINLVPPDVTTNGVTMVQAAMPLSLEIQDYTSDDLDKWQAGATVTGTFDVTTPPPSQGSTVDKSGS